MLFRSVGFETVIDIDREIALGEILNMTERRFDDIIFAQVFIDGLRLGGRFHDYECFWHRKLSTYGALQPLDG